jgi:hypothetical protein
VPAGLFERHHPFGRQHDPNHTVLLCANCHAIVSAGQVDDDIRLSAAPNPEERRVAMIGALGSHLREMGEGLLAWSNHGHGWADGPDSDVPGTKDKP